MPNKFYKLEEFPNFPDSYVVASLANTLQDLQEIILSQSVKNMLAMKEQLGFSLSSLEEPFTLLDNIQHYARTHEPVSHDTLLQADDEKL